MFLLGDGIFEMLTFSSVQEDLVGKSIEEINEIRSKVIASSFDIRSNIFKIYTICNNIYTTFCNNVPIESPNLSLMTFRVRREATMTNAFTTP